MAIPSVLASEEQKALEKQRNNDFARLVMKEDKESKEFDDFLSKVTPEELERLLLANIGNCPGSADSRHNGWRGFDYAAKYLSEASCLKVLQKIKDIKVLGKALMDQSAFDYWVTRDGKVEYRDDWGLSERGARVSGCYMLTMHQKSSVVREALEMLRKGAPDILKNVLSLRDKMAIFDNPKTILFRVVTRHPIVLNWLIMRVSHSEWGPGMIEVQEGYLDDSALGELLKPYYNHDDNKEIPGLYYLLLRSMGLRSINLFIAQKVSERDACSESSQQYSDYPDVYTRIGALLPPQILLEWLETIDYFDEKPRSQYEAGAIEKILRYNENLDRKAAQEVIDRNKDLFQSPPEKFLRTDLERYMQFLRSRISGRQVIIDFKNWNKLFERITAAAFARFDEQKRDAMIPGREKLDQISLVHLDEIRALHGYLLLNRPTRLRGFRDKKVDNADWQSIAFKHLSLITSTLNLPGDVLLLGAIGESLLGYNGSNQLGYLMPAFDLLNIRYLGFEALLRSHEIERLSDAVLTLLLSKSTLGGELNPAEVSLEQLRFVVLYELLHSMKTVYVRGKTTPEIMQMADARIPRLLQWVGEWGDSFRPVVDMFENFRELSFERLTTKLGESAELVSLMHEQRCRAGRAPHVEAKHGAGAGPLLPQASSLRASPQGLFFPAVVPSPGVVSRPLGASSAAVTPVLSAPSLGPSGGQ